MARELFANNAQDVLDGSINNSVTALDVVSASGFPATGDFRILVEDEIMLVTGVSGVTFTVVRGQEGTAAASHTDGVDVVLVVTKGSLLKLGQDNIPFFNDSTRPPLRLLDASGNLLDAADFTWDNQGTATRTDEDGGAVTLDGEATGVGSNNRRILYRSAPSTPYTIVAGFVPTFAGTFISGFLGFRQSDGKIEYIYFGQHGAGSVVGVQSAASATGSVTTKLSATRIMSSLNPLWLKIEDDGSDIIYYVSGNGINWLEVFSEGRTVHFTTGPTQVFWGLEVFTSGTVHGALSLVSWQE